MIFNPTTFMLMTDPVTFILMSIPIMALGYFICWYQKKEEYTEKLRNEIKIVEDQLSKENKILAAKMKMIPDELVKYFCIKLQDLKQDEDVFFRIYFWWYFKDNKQLKRLIELFHRNGFEIIDEEELGNNNARKFSLWFPLKDTDIRVKREEKKRFVSEIISEKKGNSNI